MSAHRNRSISAATAPAYSAANCGPCPGRDAARSDALQNRDPLVVDTDPGSAAHRLRAAQHPRNDAGGRVPALNKTSRKPAVYGERFVKRRGLFSIAVASGHGVVLGCV